MIVLICFTIAGTFWASATETQPCEPQLIYPTSPPETSWPKALKDLDAESKCDPDSRIYVANGTIDGIRLNMKAYTAWIELKEYSSIVQCKHSNTSGILDNNGQLTLRNGARMKLGESAWITNLQKMVINGAKLKVGTNATLDNTGEWSLLRIVGDKSGGRPVSLRMKENSKLKMLGYELSIYGRTILGSKSELNIGPNSVVKVNNKAWLIIADGIKLSVEARDMVIASACVVLNDTMVEQTIGVPKGLDQDPVPEQKFFGQPLVEPGLYCYDLGSECEEWNAKMDEIGYEKEGKVECKEEKVNYVFVQPVSLPVDDKKT